MQTNNTPIVKPYELCLTEGYLYCIKFSDNNVKIGTTKNNKKKLLSRYRTYYPNMELIFIINISYHRCAEKRIFELLHELKIKGEIFKYNHSIIETAFNIVKIEFPTINDIMNNISTDINTLNIINKLHRIDALNDIHKTYIKNTEYNDYLINKYND